MTSEEQQDHFLSWYNSRPPEEQEEVQRALARGAEAIAQWVDGQILQEMNEYLISRNN